MDLTRVEWRGGMSCGGSSGRVGAGDLVSKWGSSSSICSSATCLGEASKYLERSPKEDQKYLQKEQETHLERFLKQKSQSRNNESERVQQTIGVPKRQHYEKHEDDERQDHNTYTPFEFRHNQGNNIVQIEAQVCCAHEAEEKRNKQIQMSEGDDSQGVTQKDAHTESDYG